MRWKYALAFSLCCAVLETITAQVETRNLFPTPTAAGIGMYGQIPTDLFTGLPGISIPIYEFKSRDLSIPLSLSYHAGGIKPSDHASWVGLGWSLQAGGVISRIQNDLPDEWVNYTYAEAGTGNTANVKNGFFYNYGLLGDNNWLGSTYTSELICRYQEATTVTTAGCYPPYRKDKAPDEFSFNFLGMSGSLFMGQDGQWKLKSKQGLNFSVKTDIGPYWVIEPTSSNTVPKGSGLKSCITDIILTAADGTKYTFGGTSTSIEFSRVSPGTGYQDTRDGGTVPSSWYLTKIVSISGDEINLSYTRDGYQIMNYPGGIGYTYYCPTCTPGASYKGGQGTPLTDQITLQDGVTLSGITGANGAVQFNKSAANILDFSILNSYSISAATISMLSAYGYELFGGTMTSGNEVQGLLNSHSAFMKLNQIVVKDNDNTTLRSFSFSYTENPNNRLFLNSMTQTGADGTALPPFTFTYNNINGLAGVPYETLGVDHWGYFNGIDPLSGLNFWHGGGYSPYVQNGSYQVYSENVYYPYAYDNTFNATYTANREPVISRMQYGVLTQITYPTGGNTQFSWENNRYSKCLDQTPVSGLPHIGINDLSSDYPGPGLRIHQISSQANFNSPVVSKVYNYYRDYVNNNYASSGVLNSAQPKYVDTYGTTGNFTYSVWSTSNRVPLHYTNGSPITYSHVQELESDGSYKTFTYSNHDNGYGDKIPSKYFMVDYGNAVYQEFSLNSLELERGLLLNESAYKLGSHLLDSKDYQYNSDPNRLDNGVRKYVLDNKFSLSGTILNFQAEPGSNPASSGPPVYTGFNFYAFNTYIQYPFLQSTTETSYDQNGLNPLTTVANYTYDSYRNKKTENFTSSKSELVSKLYNYAPDAITGLSTAAQQGKASMLSANMVSIPLETIASRNGVQTSQARLDFQSYYNSGDLIVPANSSQALSGNALEGVTSYINYDGKGNILEYIARDGIPVSFDWGYNKTYPVAKVLNAANTFRNYLIPNNIVSSGTILWAAGDFSGQSINFTKTITGTISINSGFGQVPGSALITYFYNLTGPVSQNGVLCLSGTGSGCSYPSIVTLNNMPPGTYTLQVTPNSNYNISNAIYCSYQDLQYVPATSGAKEYFYDGFEENIDPQVVKSNAHTGNAYRAGTYATTFTPVNGRNYVIQWWQYQSGVWVFHELPYTGTTSLTGPVDDIRIFPSDAQMSTYTYAPLIGITSEITPSGKSIYYEYDALGRLSIVRDLDKNILKKICYNYAGQPGGCPVLVGNAVQSGNFTPDNCAVGYVGSAPVTYTVPAGTYFGATQQQADALAQAGVNAGGQAYANKHGSCVPGVPNDARSTLFTRNNCSSGIGDQYTYTVAAGQYYALTKTAANQLADADVAANGQAYTNTHVYCLFGNHAIDANFYSQNCPAGQTPQPYHVTIPAGTYTDRYVEIADNMATNDAQAQANAHGGCAATTPTVYARLEISPSYPELQEYAIYIGFYSDAACSTPANVPDGLDYHIGAWNYDELWINGTLDSYNTYSGDYHNISVVIYATNLLVDDIFYYDGEDILYDGDGNEYKERWKYDYTLSSISGTAVNIIIAAPVAPPHAPGF